MSNLDELREKLTGILFRAAGGISDMAQEEVDEALKFFSHHLEQAELKARIDELTKTFTEVVGDKGTPSSRYSKVTRIFNAYLKKRHAELQAQLTTNKSKENV